MELMWFWCNRVPHPSPPPPTMCIPRCRSAGSKVRLPVVLRGGGAFRPPERLAEPLIMIGPGTGVTPFRCVGRCVVCGWVGGGGGGGVNGIIV
jgi:hypothetical protein